MKVSRSSLTLLTLVSLSAAALAQTNVTALDGSQGWYPVDQRGSTSYTIESVPGDDGDGALRLSGVGTMAGTARNYVSFGAWPGYNGTSGPGLPRLGTLGDLVDGSMSIDLLRNTPLGTAGMNDSLQLAVKIIFSNNRQLTWENAYNGAGASAGTWNTVNLGTGNWWLRTAGTNYDTYPNIVDLATWETGFTPVGTGLNSNSEILGFAIGFGGGVGNFDGAADHLKVNFANQPSYNFNFTTGNVGAVPGPAAALAFALGFARRRKRA